MVDGLPWIGIANQFLADPLQMMQTIAAGHPEIARFRFFGGDGYMVTSPDLVREVLVTQARSFRKADQEVALMGRFLGNGLVTNNDWTSHKRQRRLAQPAFHANRIANYAQTMVDYTAAQLRDWYSGETRDISAEMRDLTMYIVSKTLFNADRDDISGAAREIGAAIEVFQDYTDEAFGLPFMLPAWVPTRRNRLLKQAKATVDRLLLGIIDERRRQPADTGDLLSMLLDARDEEGQPMSDKQLLDEVITLFVAGHETTSNALTWTFYLLAQHPEAAQTLHAEIDRVLAGRLPTLADLPNLPYTLMVIKEAMRLLPPVYALNGRITNEALRLGDYELPANVFVLISQWALHRDARWFPQPERFDPQRFSAANEPNIPRYGYIPFGAGPRVCIGNSFAMMEAQLLLATIAQRFALTLLPGFRLAMNPRITLSPTHGMPMRLHERVPTVAAAPDALATGA